MRMTTPNASRDGLQTVDLDSIGSRTSMPHDTPGPRASTAVSGESRRASGERRIR
jgi:hypothetical protein